MAKEKKKKSGCMGATVVIIVILAIIGATSKSQDSDDNQSERISDATESKAKPVVVSKDSSSHESKPVKPQTKAIGIDDVIKDVSLRPTMVNLTEDQTIPLILNGEQVGEQTIAAGTLVQLVRVLGDGSLELKSGQNALTVSYQATNLVEKATSLQKTIAVEKQSDGGGGISSTIIPGIYAVDVYGSLKDIGFTVEDMHNEGKSLWQCILKQGASSYTVDVYGEGPTEILSIRATATANPDTLSSEGKRFLGMIASVGYTGSSPNDARAWVEANAGKDAAKTIAGVRFELKSMSSTGMMLMVTPAK